MRRLLQSLSKQLLTDFDLPHYFLQQLLVHQTVIKIGQRADGSVGSLEYRHRDCVVRNVPGLTQGHLDYISLLYYS